MMNRVLREIRKRKLTGWVWCSLALTSLILLPNLSILSPLFTPATENWFHIQEYLLADYLKNTFAIVGGTAIFSALLGTLLAYIITFYEIRGSKLLHLLLILPLAIPPYIGAYVYAEMLSYTGTVQRFVRYGLGISAPQSMYNIMHIPGAVAMYTLFLYPYVYLLVKSFFSKQSAAVVETAQSLGKSQKEIFLFLLIPLARGAIVGGTTLVILEVLNDYGVVRYFGIPTFTTAIFRVWFSLGDIDTAIRLSGVLMLTVLVFVAAEKLLRGRRKYQYATAQIRPIRKRPLTGFYRLFAWGTIGTCLALALGIPVLQLVYWAILSFDRIASMDLFSITLNTLEISTVASIFIIVSAVILANTARLQSSWISTFLSKISTIGYAIPGAVIAMGVLLFILSLENELTSRLPIKNTAFLSSSMAMLIFAYFVRFLTIAYNSVETGFDKIGLRFYEASISLGKGNLRTLFTVDLPMITPALVSGFILVFVDILKELPLTMILRPFNYDTLAAKSFEYANDEMIHETAMTSLVIIALAAGSIILLYVLNRRNT
ncbi:ABC transporter permease [Chitinivibrio alkaliphilus]|uniref:ABC transporter, permease protein n=1 Tax=Chitinivibrio alkaliphilus ACht1 TaxID=1313304 RepID=U7DCR6_9BACT|nr:iron ABC transporter permease [Chitinivibrio alkaliphilus]ERP39353.1 ABC transporter, permease protein [Chitinivibrio alkaliphilus ACht1]